MKKRHYTMQQMGDSLCLTIKEKFLTREFGLNAGDYFQLIHEDGRLILIKTTREETSKPPRKKLTYFERLAKRAVAIPKTGGAGFC